ncbi:MAG TPA: hypothetical protein EYQ18_06715 [Candidatus Handelsmanbacteria bacterium]|nr:hypothetical protein [Candidatus Handelsmanbacteria bacterium]
MVEAVVQDVFLTVCAKIDPFRQVSSLATWIHPIAVNTALMRKRRQRRRPRCSVSDRRRSKPDCTGHVCF